MNKIYITLLLLLSSCSNNIPDLQPGRRTVVDFSDDVSPFQVLNLVQSLDLPLKPNSDMFLFSKMMVADHQLSKDSLEQLMDSGLVDRIESETIIYLDDQFEAPKVYEFNLDEDFPNDPLFHKQWNFQMVGAEEGWKHSRGNDVLVAVLDTGLTKVPDLDSTCILPGVNFTDEGPEHDVTDLVGHGTHVTGTIAQSTHNGIGVTGIAPQACILPIKVLSEDGGSTADVVDGLYFALHSGAHVVNLSLGMRTPAPSVTAAIKLLSENGVFLACATGNEKAKKISYPAADDGCHAISALNPEKQLAFYSNYSEDGDARVFLTAPGGDLRNFGEDGGILQNTTSEDGPEYLSFMGTSMATPHVSGVAALVISSLLQKDDHYKLEEVEDILIKSSEDLGSEDKYGYGLVKADAAAELANKHWLIRAFK